MMPKGEIARAMLRSLCRTALVAALPFLAAAPADARNALPPIVTSSTVPANGDVNPYGVAIVPFGFPGGGTINTGDVLVSNFNNSNNLQGTGSTIISLTPNGTIAPSGSANTFFQGPAGVGLTTALGVLERGFVIVGNTPTTDGTLATVQAGSLLVLDRGGNLVSTIPANASTAMNGPWDLTIDDHFSTAHLFVSNVLDGTVARLELAVSETGVTVTSATTIASGYQHVPNAAALVLGPTGLAYNRGADLLVVASTADNAIFAVPHAAAATSSNGTGPMVFQDPSLRGPLALAFALDGTLLTANGDAVNADPAHPSEIVNFSLGGQFIGQYNVDAGQGGAFGLAVGFAGNGSLNLVAIDDVASSVTVLPIEPPAEGIFFPFGHRPTH
jgi:hypothetical protein